MIRLSLLHASVLHLVICEFGYWFLDMSRLCLVEQAICRSHYATRREQPGLAATPTAVTASTGVLERREIQEELCKLDQIQASVATVLMVFNLFLMVPSK